MWCMYRLGEGVFQTRIYTVFLINYSVTSVFSVAKKLFGLRIYFN
jgi:hypothetical protein